MNYLLFLCVGRTARATTVTPHPTTVRHTLSPPFRSAGMGGTTVSSGSSDPYLLLTDPDPALFVLQDLHDDNKKYFLSLILYAYFFFKGIYMVHLHHSSKIKNQKKLENSRNKGFSSFFCLLMEGSDAGFVQINY